MQYVLSESDLNNEVSNSLVRSKNISFFDFLLSFYIVVMLATNYSVYNDLVSNIGLVIPVFFLFTLFFNNYILQRELLLLLAFYIWILLGSMLSDNRPLALFSTFYIFKVQFIMLVTALRCNSLPRIRFYLGTAIFSAAFLIVPSMFMTRYLESDVRLAGTVGQANALGATTAMAFVAGISLLATIKKWWQRAVVIGMIVLSIRLLLLTGSRGSVATVFISGAACSWYVWRRSRIFAKLFFPLLIFIIGIAIIYFARDLPIVDRLAGLPIALGFETGYAGTGQETSPERLDIIKIALNVFYDHPIFGAGYGTFRAYSRYVYTHTTPFELLFSTGALGTFLYYFVIAGSWYVLRKAKTFSKYNPEIGRYIIVGKILIIAELAAGMSLPTHLSKGQAIVSGIWLGTVWYIRSWTKEQMLYHHSSETDIEPDSQILTS